MTEEETLSAVSAAVGDALGLEADEVTPDSTITGELGAESIDLLDILFRIERLTGIRIQAGDLATHIQGGMSDEEFGTEDDMVSEAGLGQLKTVMPQLDIEALAGNLPAEEVISHLTVENLAAIVTRYAAVPAG
jgi:acyl carrier protein